MHAVDIATGACTDLCYVALPKINEDDGHTYFGPAAYRLHASSDGRFAAIVVDRGQHGVVVDARTGDVTMRLDGGDYNQETVPFSACFIRWQERELFVHRTAWNRLDIADPLTGTSFTDRFIAENAASKPEHYLDYFHGQLRPSPDGSRLFDDGWVWHPISVPRTWSVSDWLTSNPWESEDGASVSDLIMRDNWNTPACWVSNTHIAIWGLSDWEDDEFSAPGKDDGVRIFNATQSKAQAPERWPMAIAAERIHHLFSDGVHLYVAADTETSIWDLASRKQLGAVPAFTAHFHDSRRGALVAIADKGITELTLSSHLGR